LPYFCDRSIDFDENWHADTYWPDSGSTVKILGEFLKIQNGCGCHFEKSQKSLYLRNGLTIFTKFGTLAQNGPLNLSDR